MLKGDQLFVVVLLSVISSCKQVLTPQKLAGKWNYVKVENPYSTTPPDTVSFQDIAFNKPYIQLSTSGQLLMMWGGKILSHGTYKVEGQNISYTETMADGIKRNFPFYVKSLTDKQIIFETKEQDAVRVTAVKE
jgi:hypothetical protein